MTSPPPAIGPASGPADRPFWSVMIPSYEPGDLLGESLRSVLAQDEGPGRMQIAVVDDASPGVDVAALVRRIAGGRVEYHRNPANLGLAGNWNRAIGLARGRWVHLLHQDDLVSPGFYTALARADREAPECGAAFCQHLWIDAAGRWTKLSELELEEPGLLDDGWLRRIADNQRLQCASIVVRRDVYEALGGYREDLCMALDWEMWVRISARYPVWYEPTMLAAYRFCEGTETTRLRRQGRMIPDIERAMAIIRQNVPAGLRDYVGVGMGRTLREELTAEADRLMGRGEIGPALGRVREASRHDRSPEFRLVGAVRYYRWAAASWTRRRLGIGRPPAAPADGVRP